MDRFSVYRFYAEDDSLLYVGRSARLPQRIRDHFRHKPWWSEACRIELEHFDYEHEMIEREEVLIRELAPRYNIMLNGRGPATPLPPPVPAPAPATAAAIPRSSGQLHRPADVAERYGVTVEDVQAWKRQGVPWYRIGLGGRFAFAEVDEWLTQRGLLDSTGRLAVR